MKESCRLSCPNLLCDLQESPAILCPKIPSLKKKDKEKEEFWILDFLVLRDSFWLGLFFLARQWFLFLFFSFYVAWRVVPALVPAVSKGVGNDFHFFFVCLGKSLITAGKTSSTFGTRSFSIFWSSLSCWSTLLSTSSLSLQGALGRVVEVIGGLRIDPETRTTFLFLFRVFPFPPSVSLWVTAYFLFVFCLAVTSQE